MNPLEVEKQPVPLINSPLTLEELAKTIREMPRDPEVVEMLKKFSGVEPLPSR